MSAPDAAVVSDAAIRERAYFLWEASGRPFGRELEFWSRASAQLGSPAATVTPKPARRAKPRAPAPRVAPPVLTAAAPRSAPAKAVAAKPAKKARTAVKA